MKKMLKDKYMSRMGEGMASDIFGLVFRKFVDDCVEAIDGDAGILTHDEAETVANCMPDSKLLNE